MSKVQKSKSMVNFNQNSSLQTENGTTIPNSSMCQIDNDADYVQSVIYALTGIEGKHFKRDVITGGLKLDPKLRLSYKNSTVLLRLCEIAYNHEHCVSFTDANSGRSPLGLLGQGLITALKLELTKYYGMVAMLQEQLNRHNSSMNNRERLSLIQIEMLLCEPSQRLAWLDQIADACQEKKGGALATEIYAFKNDGNKKKRTLVHDLLVAVCTPLQFMLSKWLIEGEINDPHSEFFIEVLPEVGTDRLWNDKYRVREAMLPCFISK